MRDLLTVLVALVTAGLVAYSAAGVIASGRAWWTDDRHHLNEPLDWEGGDPCP